jgi:hypothetical protein
MKVYVCVVYCEWSTVYITDKVHCNLWDEAEDKVMTWAQQQTWLTSCYIPNDDYKRLQICC